MGGTPTIWRSALLSAGGPPYHRVSHCTSIKHPIHIVATGRAKICNNVLRSCTKSSLCRRAATVVVYIVAIPNTMLILIFMDISLYIYIVDSLAFYLRDAVRRSIFIYKIANQALIHCGGTGAM